MEADVEGNEVQCVEIELNKTSDRNLMIPGRVVCQTKTILVTAVVLAVQMCGIAIQRWPKGLSIEEGREVIAKVVVALTLIADWEC